MSIPQICKLLLGIACFSTDIFCACSGTKEDANNLSGSCCCGSIIGFTMEDYDLVGAG
jgi:hypothetical protein